MSLIEVGDDVHFTGDDGSGPYAAKVTGVHEDLVVDIVTFGPRSIYFQLGVPFNGDAKPGTWRHRIAR